MAANVTRREMPDRDLGSPRVEPTQAVPKAARHLVLVRDKAARRSGESAEHMHELAAPVVSAIVEALGQAAAAELLKVSDQHISDKCIGRRGTAFWEVVALMAHDKEAFLAFARLLSQLHGLRPPGKKPKLTRKKLARLALRNALKNEMATDALLKSAQEEEGADAADVFLTLALPDGVEDFDTTEG